MGKVFSGCISETIGTLFGGCRCAASRYDLDLPFDLAAVILTFKILSAISQKPLCVGS